MVNILGKAILGLERNLLRALNVNFLTLEDTYDLTKTLADKIKEGEFNPEMIVGILGGGYYPAKMLSEILEIPSMYMDINRPTHSFCGIDLEDILGMKQIPKISKKVPS